MRRPANTLGNVLAWLACVVCISLTLSPSSFAQELYGEWRGSGFARPSIFGKKEKIYCKIIGKASGPGKSELSGRCATTTKSRKFSLQITETGGNAVKAVANIAGSAKPFAFTGRKQTSGYVMHSDEPTTQEGIVFTSQFVISFSGSTKMMMRQTAVNIDTGKQVTVVNTAFKKQ